MKSSSIFSIILLAFAYHQALANTQSGGGTVKEVPILDWPIEVVSSDHGFTEGPAIDSEGSVYFSDLDNSRILKFDPDSGSTQVWTDESHSSNGLLIIGDWMYACEASGRAVVRYHLDRGPKSRKVLTDQFEGKRFGSPNDLAIIGDTLVFSSFYWKGILRPEDAVREIFENRCYVLSLSNGKVRALPQAFQTPNGVVFDPVRELLYLAEMKETRIYRAKVEDETIGNTELFFDLATIGKGKPDGMTVDPQGRLYVALYGMSNELLVLTPEGDVIGVLQTGRKTSNCAITEDGKTLYITAEHKLKRVRIPESFE